LAEAFEILKENVSTEVLNDRSEVQTPVIKLNWQGSALLLAAVPSKPRQATSERAKIAIAPAASKSADRQGAGASAAEPELEAKRVVQSLQDAMPEIQKNLNEIVQSKVVWEVDWQSFATNMEALQNLQYQGFERILYAARSITSDALGKSALKGAIKKVVIRNVSSLPQKQITFSKGILEIHGAWGLGSKGYPDDDQIQKAIENGL
jgi:hypothetical protein